MAFGNRGPDFTMLQLVMTIITLDSDSKNGTSPRVNDTPKTPESQICEVPPLPVFCLMCTTCLAADVRHVQ